MTTLKQHPIAWSIYSLYMLSWLYLGYAAYVNFINYADGRALGIHLFLFTIFGFIPYLVVTFLISEFSGESRPFYLLMVRLILASVPVVIIGGFVLNAIYRY
jgi:hypothetical protein